MTALSIELSLALTQLHADHAGIPSMRALSARAFHFVGGEGAERPSVMVVGEAPGQEEDRAGRPFVGPSGRLLDELLELCGISRTLDCWVTNLVKYRPVDDAGRNRTPTTREVHASAPFLLREIALLDPPIVLTLGNVPLQALWPGAPGISRCHGRARAPEGVPWVHLPAYHPSYALRSPEGRQELLGDVTALAGLLRELP